MSRFCTHCGQPAVEGSAFCRFCGQPFQAPPQTAQPAEPQQPQAPQQSEPLFMSQTPAWPAEPGIPLQPEPLPRRSRKTAWLAGLAGGLAVLVLLTVGTTALLNKAAQDPSMTAATDPTTRRTTMESTRAALSLIPFPEDLLPAEESRITCLVQTPEIIIPANYRSIDQIAHLQCWTDQGTAEVLVSVEIPGFTQKYEQKLDISRLETELSIHPALLPDASDRLNSSKDAQINITVTDLGSNRLVVQETRPVKLYSRYDMQWVGQDGTPYYENILAWVTPEAEEIRQLLRLAADSCTELTGGQLNAIVGYQPVLDWSAEDITYVQVACIMHALSAKMNVRYIMAPFSATSADLQRVATPAQVIQSAGGLCAETAVTLASAIQATNMHAVLILLPGHMQVAVETWYQSGQYFLIETTALESAASEQFNDVINYTMTTDDWYDYLAQDGMIAIDCDLADQLQIKAID